MDPLELVEIGNTGLQVSRLGIGGVAIGRTPNAEESYETLKRCVELGVRYFDTAPLYANASPPGSAEPRDRARRADAAPDNSPPRRVAREEGRRLYF